MNSMSPQWNVKTQLHSKVTGIQTQYFDKLKHKKQGFVTFLQKFSFIIILKHMKKYFQKNNVTARLSMKCQKQIDGEDQSR